MSGSVIYRAEITGMPVEAVYSQTSVDELFLPLLQELQALQKQKNRRILVFLAAPPAAGKSTLAGFLSSLCPEVTVLAMDGFHRYQSYLLSHSTVRDGQPVPMVSVKGAPETFDLEKLTAYVRRAAGGEVLGWPAYDRVRHDPVEDATLVDGGIILLEGNYLLLEQEGWQALRQYADYTIFISADETALRERLVWRKLSLGKSRAEAEQFVDSSDLPNARLVLQQSAKADLALELMPDGEYKRKES